MCTVTICRSSVSVITTSLCSNIICKILRRNSCISFDAFSYFSICTKRVCIHLNLEMNSIGGSRGRARRTTRPLPPKGPDSSVFDIQNFRNVTASGVDPPYEVDRYQNTANNKLGIYGSYAVGDWVCNTLWADVPADRVCLAM